MLKNDQNNAIQQVLVDNFLKTQNMLSLATGGKLLSTQELKSMPSSPGNPNCAIGAKNRTRQLQSGTTGQVLNNKNRRLTTSVSSTTIPEMRNQNFTPQSHYNTVKQQLENKDLQTKAILLQANSRCNEFAAENAPANTNAEEAKPA